MFSFILMKDLAIPKIDISISLSDLSIIQKQSNYSAVSRGMSG